MKTDERPDTAVGFRLNHLLFFYIQYENIFIAIIILFKNRRSTYAMTKKTIKLFCWYSWYIWNPPPPYLSTNPNPQGVHCSDVRMTTSFIRVMS